MVHVPIVEGAVKSPEELMLPQEVAQLTGRLAVNCCVNPGAVVALVGETVSGLVMVATVDAVWPVPSVAVAVTVQDVGARGAVNNPEVLMEPHVAAHVAAALAVNCFVVAPGTEGVNGEIVNVDPPATTRSYP